MRISSVAALTFERREIDLRPRAQALVSEKGARVGRPTHVASLMRHAVAEANWASASSTGPRQASSCWVAAAAS
jgi:hypothetical protein